MGKSQGSRRPSVLDNVRGKFDRADAIEKGNVSSDIRAQQVRTEAALDFFEKRDQVEEEARRLRISVATHCKRKLKVGESHLRRLRQLHQRWDKYVTKRRAYKGDRWGLRLAFELVGIPIDGKSSGHGVSGQDGVGTDHDRPHYWLTPPETMAKIVRDHGEVWDACPYPLPDGHDALVMRWPRDRTVWLNMPFTRKDESNGRPAIAYVKKAIEQANEGSEVVIPLPTTDAANLLFAAGAEVQSLGRLAWLDVKTGEPWPNPGASALFILRRKGRRP